MSVFITYYTNLLKKLKENKELTDKELTKLDNEIIDAIKDELFNLSLSSKNREPYKNVYRITILSLMQNKPELEKIITDALTNNLFEDFINSGNSIMYSTDTFHYRVAKKIMDDNNSFDIILQFEGGKKINIHSFLLKQVGYFGFITDCENDEINDEIKKIDLNFNYDYFKSVVEYLYTGEVYYGKNCIDYILFVDSLNIENDNYYINELMSHCILNIERNIEQCFIENTFENFLHKMAVFIDIYGSGDYCIFKSIRDWVLENNDKYCMETLTKAPIFNKKCGPKLFGYKIVVKFRLYDLFVNVADEKHFNVLINILIANNPPDISEIMLMLSIKFPELFEQYISQLKLPYGFDNIDNTDTKLLTNKNLIEKYNLSSYYNEKEEMKEDELVSIIRLMEFGKNSDHKGYSYLWNMLYNFVNAKIVYKKDVKLCNYGYYTHIYSLFPLKFKSYMFIGSINSVLCNNKGEIYGVCMITGMYGRTIKVGTPLIIGKYYGNDRLVIKELYLNDLLKQRTNELLLEKNTCDEIIIIFEKCGPQTVVRVDDDIFYEMCVY